MKTKIKKIHTKFDALQLREKIMITILLFVLLVTVWQVLVFDESEINNIEFKNKIKAQLLQISSAKTEISAYNDRFVNNPNAKLLKEQKNYLNKIEILDNKLNKKMKGLINPKKMNAMLRDIFKSNKKLTLVSLEKLKTTSIFNFSNKKTLNNGSDINITDNINSGNKDGAAVVYRHPVKIIFTGSFLNAMTYLEVIEKMPWDLYWDEVQLDVDKYPQSTIVITVFTLSLKKGWVGV